MEMHTYKTTGHQQYNYRQAKSSKTAPNTKRNDSEAVYETLSVATQQVTSEYQEPQKSNVQHTLSSDKSDKVVVDRNQNRKKFLVVIVLLVIIFTSMTLTSLVLAAISFSQSVSPDPGPREVDLLSNQLTAAIDGNDLSQALYNATQDNIRLANDIKLLKDQVHFLTITTQHNRSMNFDQATNISLEDVKSDVSILNDQLRELTAITQRNISIIFNQLSNVHQ